MRGTNAYPSRSYPEETPGIEAFAPVGGAHGPAALPARVLVAVPPAPPAAVGGAFGALTEDPLPAPAPVRTFVGTGMGANGPAAIPSRVTALVGSIRRGAAVIMLGRSPGVQNVGEVQNELGHASIIWRRPRYENAAGLLGYMPPTKMPSWTANGTSDAGLPRVSIPTSTKSIVWATVQREYGRDRQLFPLWGTRRPQSSAQVQGRRWQAQAKTSNPLTVLLTRYGLAPSYGSTTITLPTTPSTTPAASPGGMGAY